MAVSSLFCGQPTTLESAILQAANDLKVTGFGQRTRATLRRNRAAGGGVVPYAATKDIQGPDLVRELNALHMTSREDMPNPDIWTPVDQELVTVLYGQLDTVRALVGGLWACLATEGASVFVDYDNVPIPFCPMYPNARDFIDKSDVALSQPLAKIMERLGEQIKRTDPHLPALTSAALRELTFQKERFAREVAPQPTDETYGGWRDRLFRWVHEARLTTPEPFLQLNKLIHTTVSCTVSLAVWGHRITADDVLSSSAPHPNTARQELRVRDCGADLLSLRENVGAGWLRVPD